MNTYQTYLTLDHSQKIILSNLPFPEGAKLSINIQVIEDESLESTSIFSSNFETLLDNTQEIWTKGDGLE